MKKILAIILPSILILAINFWGRAEKNILIGLFLLFPIIFIIQGIMSLDKKELLIGLIISSLAFIIPINLWFNMGACIELLVIYNTLSIISFCIKRNAISKRR